MKLRPTRRELPPAALGWRLAQFLQALSDQILVSLSRVPDRLIGRQQLASLPVGCQRARPIPGQAQRLTEPELVARDFWVLLRGVPERGKRRLRVVVLEKDESRGGHQLGPLVGNRADERHGLLDTVLLEITRKLRLRRRS